MRGKGEKIFWGVFLILAAVFIIVSQLGFLEGVGIFSTLFAVFWVAVLIKGIIKLRFGEILFPLAFLCIIFDEQLKITAITPWTVLGAALLGTIGLNLIFRRKNHWHIHHNGKYVNINHGEEGFERVVNDTDGTAVTFSTSFGSAVKYVNSENFEYASLECSFGAIKVYFDNAVIPSGNATIDLDVSFGAAELYFPKQWTVVNHADTSFGGIEEKNRNNSTGSPVVTLTGDASFSGVTIIYV